MCDQEAYDDVMSATDFDPKALTVDQRLELIDKLWMSIAVDAQQGDERARQAVNLDRGLDLQVLAELERRADAIERDPSQAIPWEVLRDELRRRHE